MGRGGEGRRGPTIKKLMRPGVREAVDWELQNHIEERVERLMEKGMAEAEARKEAVRRMGDLERYRAELKAEGTAETGRRWIMGGFETVLQDTRYAFRGIRKNPGFATTLILTLALGIGATGAIFSVIDAVMLRPLPYLEADRLVEVNLLVRGDQAIPEVIADQVDDLTQGADYFSSLALTGRRSMVRTDQGDPAQLSTMAVSHQLDDVLGIQVQLGRAFKSDDAVPGVQRVVLTDGYWRSQGADREVVGREIELDGSSWTVVGVLAPGIKFPVAGTSDIWVNMSDDRAAGGAGFSQVGMVGRLQDGITLEVAQERADALSQALTEEKPHQVGWNVRLNPVGAWRANPDTARGLWMVGGAVGLMLLIALFNGINLLLVRAQARTGEVSVRKAMGASRLRVIRQIIAESVILSLIGGVVSTGVAALAVEGVSRIAPRELTFGMAHDFGLEGRALFVVFSVATLTGLVVGLLPAWKLGSTPVQGAGASMAAARGRAAHRLRGLLVGLEVATSVVLLIGAGLFLRSFGAMTRVDLGMEAERLAFAGVQLPRSYQAGSDRAEFVRQVTERLNAIPGVVRAIPAQGLPPEGGGLTFGDEFQAEGGEPLPGFMVIPFGQTPEGYLETLGARLLSGRDLTAADRETHGVVIDADLARTVFGQVDVSGRRFRTGSDADWLTVVGVVEELRLGGVDDQNGDGVILHPFNFDAPPAYLDFAVRTSGEPEAILQEIRRAVLSVDARLPMRELQTAEAALGEAVIRPRFLVLLMTILAGIALSLAAVGIYGVLSYVVRQGRHEMGIRIALGAPVAKVRAGVLRWGLLIGSLGTAVGLGISLLLDDLIGTLLFGVEPGDIPTQILVAGTMMLVTVAACWLPAHRATKVDPVEVLKAE